MMTMPTAGIILAPQNGQALAMARFPLHTRATAPFEAKLFLEQAGQSIGHVPALLAQMAEAPALLEGYASLSAIYRKSGLAPDEQQLVLLTAAVALGGHDCIPAHAGRAGQVALDETVIAAVQAGRALAAPRQEALRRFALAMSRSRGEVAPADLDAFLAAGFTPANALEVVLAVGLKTLSACAARLARTPLDPPTVGRRLA